MRYLSDDCKKMVSFYIDKTAYELLRHLAKKKSDGRNISDFIREGVDEVLSLHFEKKYILDFARKQKDGKL